MTNNETVNTTIATIATIATLEDFLHINFGLITVYFALTYIVCRQLIRRCLYRMHAQMRYDYERVSQRIPNEIIYYSPSHVTGYRGARHISA